MNSFLEMADAVMNNTVQQAEDGTISWKSGIYLILPDIIGLDLHRLVTWLQWSSLYYFISIECICLLNFLPLIITQVGDSDEGGWNQSCPFSICCISVSIYLSRVNTGSSEHSTHTNTSMQNTLPTMPLKQQSLCSIISPFHPIWNTASFSLIGNISSCLTVAYSQTGSQTQFPW